MVEFKGYKLELELEAQTPMIHFQPYENGCTIRASEVKPKLDRFLAQKLGYERLDPKYYVSKEADAFDYKMQIIEKGNAEVVDLDSYKIFYANSGLSDAEKKKGVFSNPTVTIICFHAKLRMLIAEYMEEFFLVTNFGTMQGKGFGSFIPKLFCGMDKQELNPDEIVMIGNILKFGIGTTKCYYMTIKRQNLKNQQCINIFNAIKMFYQIMKSGNNNNKENFDKYLRGYMALYMHEHKIDNEKAWMKEKKIAPIIGMKTKEQYNKNPQYVRSMLGIGAGYKFARENIRLEHVAKAKNEKIERVASPIFFKVVKNTVFIVARDIPEELFNQEFKFTNTNSQKSGRLFTPIEFDIQDFLEKYVQYYNEEAKKKISTLAEVKEVDCK